VAEPAAHLETMGPVPSGSEQPPGTPPRPPRGGAGALARAFLVLSGCIEAALLVVASGATALGLFMTWGDPGSRTGNAAKALVVLFLLVGGATALLVWAGRTAGSGS
jgi:hypothetical protein